MTSIPPAQRIPPACKTPINISCTTSTRVLCRRSPRKATSVACGGATLPQLHCHLKEKDNCDNENKIVTL